MKIVELCRVIEGDANVYSVVLEGEQYAEYDNFIDNYSNETYLRSVITSKADINKIESFHLDKVVEETIESVFLLDEQLQRRAKRGSFSGFAKNLSDSRVSDDFFKIHVNDYLRLYGIRFGNDLLLVVNGGFKVTKTMQEDPQLENCLKELKFTLDLLNRNQISVDDFSNEIVSIDS